MLALAVAEKRRRKKGKAAKILLHYETLEHSLHHIKGPARFHLQPRLPAKVKSEPDLANRVRRFPL